MMHNGFAELIWLLFKAVSKVYLNYIISVEVFQCNHLNAHQGEHAGGRTVALVIIRRVQNLPIASMVFHGVRFKTVPVDIKFYVAAQNNARKWRRKQA